MSPLSLREYKDGLDGVLAVRVGELFAEPKLAKTAERINDWLNKGLNESAGFLLPIQVQDIDQLTCRLYLQFKDGPKRNLVFGGGLSAIRMTKPTDWVKIIRAIPNAKVWTRDGKTTFRFTFEILKLFPEEVCKMIRSVWRDRLDGKELAIGGRVVDDRTVLMGEPDSPKANTPAPEWKEVEEGSLAFVLYIPKPPQADRATETRPKEVDETPVLRWLPSTARVVVGIDTRERFQVKAWIVCHISSEAEELEKSCITWLKGIASAAAEDIREERKPINVLFAKLTASAVVKRVGEKVKITLQTDKP